MKHSDVLIKSADIATYPPAATLGPRSTDFHEALWIIEGDVKWTYDGVTHAMPPGSFFIRRPGPQEKYCWDPVAITRHAYVEFSVRPGCTNPFMERKWPVSLVVEPDSLLPLLLQRIVSLFQARGDDWEALSVYALNCCLALYATHQAEPLSLHDQAKGFAPEVQRIIRHIANAWQSHESMRTFSVEELMAVGHISRATLFRLFQKHFDMSPMQVLRKARLERGARLLIRTEMTVQEIAWQTGFDLPFHFSKRFKEQFGLCPTDFRRVQRTRDSIAFNISPVSRLFQEYTNP